MTQQSKDEIEKDLSNYMKRHFCGDEKLRPDIPLLLALPDDCCRDELLLYVGRRYGVHIPDALLEGDKGLSLGGLIDVLHASKRQQRTKTH